jgi:formate dehydrogenase iron-sulfur subunit
VDQLKAAGESRARLYGADPEGPLGGLNAFFLLVDEPEAYGLPADPALPSRNLASSATLSAAGAVVAGAVGLVTLRHNRMKDVAEAEGSPKDDSR